MNSLRLRLYSIFTRLVIKPWVQRVKNPVEARQAFERHARRMHRHPAFAAYRNGVIGKVPVLWASVGPVSRPEVLLYLHGGGFIVGSPDTHKHMVADIAGAVGVEAVIPRYRLAPENPFPAGFDDVLEVYNGLLARGLRPDQIMLGGDSAGGNLVLSLLAHLSYRKEEIPLCAFVISPVVNLEGGYDSLKENAKSEVLLSAGRFDELGKMYLGHQDCGQDCASPIHAMFERCPPILFHHSSGEILRDDTLEMQRKLVAKGHDVLVRSWPNAFHVFHIMRGHFPEARAALDDIAGFLKARLTSSDS
ncbi:alpha/beta hydrolase [Neptunicoccus sediminis]|uniref:alpha/beta hydrolase n=1 Tax=Neptunicoccus sediminis TaxID=1892596 RepID=UPI00084602B5|nr:alpha/beta hydrolase [Neptunicoccus sediminis]